MSTETEILHELDKWVRNGLIEADTNLMCEALKRIRRHIEIGERGWTDGRQELVKLPYLPCEEREYAIGTTAFDITPSGRYCLLPRGHEGMHRWDPEPVEESKQNDIEIMFQAFENWFAGSIHINRFHAGWGWEEGWRACKAYHGLT